MWQHLVVLAAWFKNDSISPLLAKAARSVQPRVVLLFRRWGAAGRRFIPLVDIGGCCVKQCVCHRCHFTADVTSNALQCHVISCDVSCDDAAFRVVINLWQKQKHFGLLIFLLIIIVFIIIIIIDSVCLCLPGTISHGTLLNLSWRLNCIIRHKKHCGGGRQAVSGAILFWILFICFVLKMLKVVGATKALDQKSGR